MPTGFDHRRGWGLLKLQGSTKNHEEVLYGGDFTQEKHSERNRSKFQPEGRWARERKAEWISPDPNEVTTSGRLEGGRNVLLEQQKAVTGLIDLEECKTGDVKSCTL